MKNLTRPVRRSTVAEVRIHEERPGYLQIADAIVHDIRRGRLRPDDPIPSSRALATSAGVHRNTVLAAYDELRAQGWITTEKARGTFVSSEIPIVSPSRSLENRLSSPVRRGSPEFELPRAKTEGRIRAPSVGIQLNGGLPDTRILPIAELARAYRRALTRHGRRLVAYGDTAGYPPLKTALANLISSTRGLVVDPSQIVVTRGSQMALYLIAQTLLRPGDRVAVESFGYRPAFEALRLAGAELISIPVDTQGMRIERLRALVQTRSIQAVYLTPHHQCPTTVTLAPGRRMELLDLARTHRFSIIEDDYDHEFHYEGRPIFPLASEDDGGVVIYVGTLSKVFAPGLRIGYVAACDPVIDRLTRYRACVDGQGDHVVEAAIADLIEDGELERHTARARRIYQGRRDLLGGLLEKHLGDVLRFSTPPGGMAIWSKVRGVDVEQWAERAASRGVSFSTGRQFSFDGRKKPYARFGFGTPTEAEIEQGVRILAKTARLGARHS